MYKAGGAGAALWRGVLADLQGEGLLAREEYELPLPEESYRQLLAKADGAVIEKVRYYVPWKGHTIELDVFEGALAPLVFAEVEFSTREEALAFRAPDWFGRDVTCEPGYSNAALSREGAPFSKHGGEFPPPLCELRQKVS